LRRGSLWPHTTLMHNVTTGSKPGGNLTSMHELSATAP
jgi:hypothetical protein